jgi:AAHS family 4-hydroxybenzoate transporter-like MFS transporter
LLGLMYCGFTLGAAGGGFVAAAVIPAFGWRAVFIIGGALPLLLAAFLLALPESIRFMVIRQWPADKIKAVLQRIAGVAAIEATRFTLPDDSSGVRTSPLAVILGPRYRTGTLMLWLSYFMANLVLYLVTSWMPTLLKELGMSTQQASVLTALFPLGGALGALVCGYLLDKMNPHRVTGAAFFLAGVLMCALGQAGGAYATVLTFGAGFFTGGGFFALSVLAAAYYPTHGRASGVAWMQGVGRFGGILGAVAGGALLQMGLDFAAILGVLAVPPLIASAAVLYKQTCHRKLQMVAQPVGA